MSAPVPPPTTTATVLDKHLTTLMNCLQTVLYALLLMLFVEVGMSNSCFFAKIVSPVESWKGLFYNMFYSVLVFGMMMAFKDTLKVLLLFDYAKRRADDMKGTTTYYLVGKDLTIKHVDNGSTSSGWQTMAGYILSLNKTEDKTKEQVQDAPTESKEAALTSPPEDEIKPDTASASSSARSSADTSEALN
jgi:hypothetical protein